MTKQTKKRPRGNPDSAFKLSRELFATLRNSDLLKNSKDNPLFAFDLLMSLGEFSALVLKVLCASSVAGDDLKTVYIEDILPTFLDYASPVDDVINEFKQTLVAQPDLN